MYCEMLANAVHEMKHEKVESLPTTMIDLGSPTYIPKNYVPLDRHRMDAYRKIAVARTPADLQQIEAELADVYGPLPDEVKLLLEIAELRSAASHWHIRSIVASGNDLVFSFKQDPGRKANALFANVRGSVRIPDPKTINLRLAPSYFEPRTLISLLRKIFSEGKK
jgi:transcription-repair coupling factor (superfamily II helicase)